MKTTTAKHYRGLVGLGRAWLIARLARDLSRLVVLCKDRTSAENLVTDLTFFLRESTIYFLSGWETLPFEPVSPESQISASRVRAFDALARRAPGIVVATVDAVFQRTISLEFIERARFSLKRGQQIVREPLLADLTFAGFRRVALVEEVGDVAVRGGVIDLFPSTTSEPVRIEFLDDVIESIRTFDLESQRSIGDLAAIEVVPVRESIELPRLLGSREALDEALERVKIRGKELETPPREIAFALHALRSGNVQPGIELIQTIALDRAPSLFEIAGPETLFLLDDPLAIERAGDHFSDLVAEREERLRADHYLVPTKEQLFLSPDEVRTALAAQNMRTLDHLDVRPNDENASEQPLTIRSRPNTELALKLKTKVGTGKALAPLKDFLTNWRRDGFRVAFVVGAQSRAERLQRLLLDITIDATLLTKTSGSEWMASADRNPLAILLGQVSQGVQLPDERLVFIAESEVFSERSHRKAARSARSLKRILSSLAQLKEGDHVVHVDFGIGLYHGLVHLDVEGATSDFLHIDYADSRLYLPVQNIGKVQKFVASEGKVPILDKLSSNRWLKTKQKVRESVVELAGDLIKLYAARTVVQGWRYEPMGAEDERFADGFPFNETADQMKAIEETIAAMASERPMDRLVCGDVGFGKTEVALRAAYKCTQHARQVAVLVPTTILVEQHKNTFIERFAGYPVKVGAVSRFYDRNKNKETLAQLASGELDIVIGTHRLLQRDVEFKDLGLLIVDEEHRFGVKQKERLKQLRTQVDVLTLTATPIPRTLHMSLLGIRDISVITTPPTDRRVIHTYVASRQEGLIRDAIMREIQRGGQCFYVFNRVQGIELLTAELQTLVPEARFAFGHGQMSEHQLESIMRKFLNHEVDVLVSTTIVESGLDIPNANTIIIDRADMFGLAQLYQLRGRVGRSSRQAYAYLLVPPARSMSVDAQKRLKVLQSLDELGIGFNLAMRDLEIRGAGNLLGKEQSGNVLAVGFELYTKILKEAVLNLKGEDLEIGESVDPEVKLGVNAFIPDYFIPDISERLVLYQRLAALSSSSEADELEAEIVDRFGPFGSEVRNLIELMRLRSLLRDHGVVKAEFARSRLLLSFSPKAPIDAEKILALVQRKPEIYRFTKQLTLSVALERESIENPREIYSDVAALLSGIARSVLPTSQARGAA